MLLVLSINRSNDITIFSEIPEIKIITTHRKDMWLRVIVKPRGMEFSLPVNLSKFNVV